VGGGNAQVFNKKRGFMLRKREGGHIGGSDQEKKSMNNSTGKI